MSNNLLIVGATPESAGVGGVTVHVERLLQFLNKKGFSYELFDYRKDSLFGIFGKVKRSNLVHLHVCNHYFMFVLAVICRMFGKKYVLTLHGKYTETEQKPWMLIKYAIKKATVPIVLNQISYDACIGINPRTTIIPAFIPPQKDDVLEPAVKDIIERIHREGKKVAVTYGSDGILDANGREVYGVSFLLPVFDNNIEYSLIVSDPIGSYKRKYAKIYPNIYFIDYPLSLYELLKLSDVFVRNTSKDGDSLSIKEALYLHKKVICTDVVERPQGVCLYTYSDKDSFVSCLNSDTDYNNVEAESGEEKILDLYRQLI